jgi:tetratricopeptide (TPR) repeat protein
MIVTFYSFKGGVGRSMALANIARQFQLRGLNVVMVDWDLEAPGLETFFSADSAQLRSWKDQVGLMDLLLLYRQDHAAIPFPRTGTPPPAGDVPAGLEDADIERKVSTLGETSAGEQPRQSPGADAWSTIERDATRLRELLPPLKFSLVELPPPPPASTLPSASTSAPPASTAPPPGRLRMLTAGWREGPRFAAYANAVQSFDWNDFYASYHGHAYFEWLRTSLDDPAVADIVLIDSRTGVTEMGGVSTRQLADVVVVLAAPNRQNVEGAVQMARSFERPELVAERGGRRIGVVMVPSRIDVAASEVKQAFEDDFTAAATPFMPEALKRLEADFWSLRIPYVNKYAFSERLSTGERDGDPDLNASYTSLAAYVAWLAPDSSRVKSAMAQDFERVFGADRVRRARDYGAQFEQRWSEIPPALFESTRELLQRLVDARAPGSTTEHDRARVVLESQLRDAFREAIDAAESAGLVDRVADADGTVTLRLAESEYVTRSNLARWIEEDRVFLVWRQRLRFFMEDWREKGRDRGSLLQGGALAEATRMVARAKPVQLLADEREFIQESVEASRPQPVASMPAPPYATSPASAGTPPLSPTSQSTTYGARRPEALKVGRRSWVPLMGVGLGVTAVAAFAWIGLQGNRGGVTSREFADSLLAGRRHAADSSYDNAIAAYSVAIALDSSSAEARRLRAEAQVAAGRPALALPDLDRAISAAPSDVRLLSRRAQIRASVDDTSGALEDLGRLPVDSMDAATLRLRAELYDAARQDSAALTAFDAVVQRGDTAAGQLGRGRVLERMGRRGDAVQAYRTAASTTSDDYIVTFAQTRLRILAPGTLVTPASTARVYLQYLAAADTVLTAPIDSSLRRAGLRLEADSLGRKHEVVDSGKTAGEIRYFRTADEGLARRVQVAVEGALAANGIFLRLTNQFVRLSADQRRRMRQAGQVEVWLPPLNTRTQTQQVAPRPSKRPD